MAISAKIVSNQLNALENTGPGPSGGNDLAAVVLGEDRPPNGRQLRSKSKFYPNPPTQPRVSWQRKLPPMRFTWLALAESKDG